MRRRRDRGLLPHDQGGQSIPGGVWVSSSQLLARIVVQGSGRPSGRGLDPLTGPCRPDPPCVRRANRRHRPAPALATLGSRPVYSCVLHRWASPWWFHSEGDDGPLPPAGEVEARLRRRGARRAPQGAHTASRASAPPLPDARGGGGSANAAPPRRELLPRPPIPKAVTAVVIRRSP